ncbi:MAG: hypothetical protein MRK02_11660 [Candidatus Scalindua sp.]|nr:hypothetical protein [Candidatus Scalindua sp.]
MAAIKGEVTGTNSVAVTGIATGKETTGVSASADTVGVRAYGKDWIGVFGETHSTVGGAGVWGRCNGNSSGVFGESQKGTGVYGKSSNGGAGVIGEGDTGPGIIGKSTKWVGVYGETAGIENGPAGVWGEHKGAGVGVKAVSKDGAGLAAYSTSNEAIHAETKSPGTAAIAAYNLDPAGTGAAIFAKKAGTIGNAGSFDGNVEITGNLFVQGASIQGLLQRIAQLEQQGTNVGQLVQRLSSLEQKVAALESQINTAVSNLNGRVTQTEIAISDLKAKVQQIITQLG